MSFLLRRNKPVALARWTDSFDRPNENPVRPPWQRIGGSTTVEVENNRLKVGFGAADYVSGASYEFQPFTPYWGYEFDMVFENWPGFPAGQPFAVLMGPSWSKVNPSFDLTVGFRCASNALNGGTLVMVLFPNNVQQGTVLWSISVSNWWTTPHRIRVWVDGDRICRFWMDGELIGIGKVPANYAFREHRRGANFNNQTFQSAYVDNYTVYDRPRDDVGWWNPNAPLFIETFSMGNTANPGNGWVRQGNQDAAVQSGSWGVTGGTDPVRHLIQTETLLPETGDVRIEHTFGTAPTAANTGIILRMNDAGTVGIAVIPTSMGIGIARISGSASSPSYTVLKNHSANISAGANSVIAAMIIGDTLYGSIDGEILVGYSGVDAISPRTNRRWGIMTARGSFINSARIDNVQMFGQLYV